MTWWLGAAYFLGAVLVLGGTSVVTKWGKFLGSSDGLEKILSEKLKIITPSTSQSEDITNLVKEVFESGKKLTSALSDTAKSYLKNTQS